MFRARELGNSAALRIQARRRARRRQFGDGHRERSARIGNIEIHRGHVPAIAHVNPPVAVLAEDFVKRNIGVVGKVRHISAAIQDAQPLLVSREKQATRMIREHRVRGPFGDRFRSRKLPGHCR